MSKKIPYEEFERMVAKPNIIFTDKTKEMYNGTHSIIECECLKHGKMNIEARRLIKSQFGCDKCAREYKSILLRKSTEQFINESIEIFGNKFSYDKTEYINCKTKVILACKKHGDFLISPKDHLNKKEGCPLCKESKLERELANELNNENVTYERNTHLSFLEGKELDFYLPKYMLAIECQGKQHFGIGGWSDNFDFDKQYERDIAKYKSCFDRGIRLIYFTDKAYSKYAEENEFYKDKDIFYNKSSIMAFICSLTDLK